ncbi:hypothetical protein FNU79_16150 [Deinococcus detaillensis]|uniref:Uncharacterized protein n=1 Tax=Deinococcus detaillensis TaxID=2592048 RepID=A0A553UKS5_9DEIO|nr:hypothetical protein FNU79_16150 [Deinococcus detaillensis]
MEPIKLLDVSVKRQKAPSNWPDFNGFFMFFGVSGVDHNREERLEKRFKQRFYPNQVTVRLSGQVAPGPYSFKGLPESVNYWGWIIHKDGTATSDLSDEALADLRSWMQRVPRASASLIPL